MRIAMVGPFGLHPNQTMRSRALPLARPLAQHGYTVKLFMPPWQTPQEADKSWQDEQVTLRYVPLRGGVVGITQRLLQEVLAWQPDIVHCFKPKAYSGLVAWWLWQFHRRTIKLVVDTDDWEGWGGWNEKAPYTAGQKLFFAWQEQWGLRHHHALTVASRALQTITWSLGVTRERVVYVPNGAGIGGVSVDSYQYLVNSGKKGLNGEQSLLVYSRLFEFDTGRLVAVLRGVKTAVPQLSILLVGAGLYEQDTAQFRQQLAQAGLLEAVVDTGWVEASALPGVLATADVGVYLMDDTLLNRTKCPVKLADMLSVGVPVVAEAVGQVTEYVVNGRTGLLRPTGDVAGLTADLVHLLHNQAERNRLSAAAQQHLSEQFSWERLATRLEQLYETL